MVVVMMMSANWEEETAEGWTRRARQRGVCKTIKRIAVVVVIATPFLNPATIVTLNNASAHPRMHRQRARALQVRSSSSRRYVLRYLQSHYQSPRSTHQEFPAWQSLQQEFVSALSEEAVSTSI